MPPAERVPVLIIGGGLAGLTAALHLAERGLRPLLLEADPEHPGGRLTSGAPLEFEQAGRRWRFSNEHGVHAIWSPYRALQAMLSRHHIRPVLVPAQEELWCLGKGDHVKRAAIGSVIRGSWIPAPLHYLGLFGRPAFLGMLGLRDWAALPRVLVTLLAALSIDPLAEDQPLYGMTLADVCHHWSPNLTALFTGLSRNALPAALERIPASGFFAFLRFYTLLRRDAWAFSYLPDPAGVSLVTPLVRVIGALGGELRLGAQALSLSPASDGVAVQWEQAGQRFTTHAEAVVLAVDAPAILSLLANSAQTADAVRTLRLPSAWPTAVVRLWFARQPRPSQPEAGMFSGDLVLDNFFWLDRIYNEYIEWRRATGGSALESHIYGPPELLAQSDAALLAQAIVAVTRTWPELRGQVIHSTLTRNPPTHTLLHAGRPEEHLGVETPWPRIYCCGDWVRDPHPALFMERACVTGIKAANAVLRARGLAPWLLPARLSPEPLAAWLETEMRALRAGLRARRITRG